MFTERDPTFLYARWFLVPLVSVAWGMTLVRLIRSRRAQPA
jgi:hypothetical protein